MVIFSAIVGDPLGTLGFYIIISGVCGVLIGTGGRTLAGSGWGRRGGINYFLLLVTTGFNGRETVTGFSIRPLRGIFLITFADGLILKVLFLIMGGIVLGVFFKASDNIALSSNIVPTSIILLALLIVSYSYLFFLYNSLRILLAITDKSADIRSLGL